MSLESFISECEKYIGYYEYPANSNMTRFGAWYGADGEPWCDMFISYCAEQSGEGVVIGRFAYCPYHERFFRDAGVLMDPRKCEPQRGDIAFFAYDDGVPAHVGVVTGFADDGTVYTVEGNTSSSSDDNGGTVARRKRFIYTQSGFHICSVARPEYSEDEMLSDDDIKRIARALRAEMVDYIWGYEARDGSSAINELANIKARADSNGRKLDILLALDDDEQ